MAEENFVHKTLDKLLDVIEVELKLPLGIAEVKMSPTAIAKEWRENEKKRNELENAIQRAEERFVADHKEQKVAQMLREFPLHAEDEFRQVIAGLLTHLREEEITWLAEVQLTKIWGNIANTEEIRNALGLYLPYLRHELSTLEEFRDAVSALRLERIEKTTEQIDKRTERMETKLDEALKLKTQPSPSGKMKTGWFYGHRYGDLAAFTGRADELKMLDDWLANDHEALLMITAFGGFGKSALTWQWFNNRVDKTKWQTAVWWSFYEKESGFESFLAETLAHLGVEVKASARLQVNDLLEALRGTNILIVLDGFERLLRQYGRMDAALQPDDEDAEIDPSQRDCSSPLTETFLRGLSGAGMQSKVLLTTRLCPRVLESADGKLLKGCREAPLAAFSPEDAVTYFHNEGIKATRAEILALCAAYGYHPLSLSLLVGLINADHERRGDIEAVKNLEIFEDVKARRHHVLERAYGNLAPERRDLLSKMSCFRGSMEYDTIKKVFASKPSGNFLTKLFKSQADNNFDLDKSLLDLRQRGLLQYAGETQRYDMHPIVRHYAYDHFTDEKRRREAHVQLAEHFIDVMPVTNTKVKTLEDLAPVIELYHHMVGAGNLDEAWKLYYDRLQKTIYYQFGACQLQIELLRVLFPDGENKPPRLKRDDCQRWTLNELANTYSISGQPHLALPLYENFISLSEGNNDKENTIIGLGNVAVMQLTIGALKEADHNMRRRIDLCYEIENESREASSRLELGRALSYLGMWEEAEREFANCQNFFDKHGVARTNYVNVVRAYRAQMFIFTNRVDNALKLAKDALDLATSPNRSPFGGTRDIIRAHWLLGSAYRANNELTLAEENLSKALNLCRQINMVDHEADILLDVARLYYAYGSRYVPQKARGTTRPSDEAEKYFQDAQEKASEALVITERCGYVLQGADVNLFLATLALEGYKLESLKVLSNEDAARKHAEEALKLATCDGPPYYYKVAYDEAVAMLERLNV